MAKVEKINPEKYPAAKYEKEETEWFLQGRVNAELDEINDRVEMLGRSRDVAGETTESLDETIMTGEKIIESLHKLEVVWPLFIHYASNWHPEAAMPEQFKKRFEEVMEEEGDGIPDLMVSQLIHAVADVETAEMNKENKLRLLGVISKAAVMIKILQKELNFTMDFSHLETLEEILNNVNKNLRKG